MPGSRRVAGNRAMPWAPAVVATLMERGFDAVLQRRATGLTCTRLAIFFPCSRGAIRESYSVCNVNHVSGDIRK